jgi:hypothetical protein
MKGIVAVLISLAACAPGTDPDPIPVETVQQGLIVGQIGPIADWVPNRVIIGRVAGSGHWVVHQRQDTMACSWRKISDRGLSLTQDISIWTGNSNDIGIVASDSGTTINCDGFTYTLYAPTQVDESGYYMITMEGGHGNDVLHCQGFTYCQGGPGNDEIMVWNSGFGWPYFVTVDAGAGNDKVRSYTTGWTSIYGGTGQDCIAAVAPALSIPYSCGPPDDPEWDRSAGTIGYWCNELSTDFCTTGF